MKSKLLICTPIKDIKDLYKKLEKYFILSYRPNVNANKIKNLSQFDYIFTNPNMSKIRFNQKFLIKCKKLKAICTASTGTNHIDLNYIKKNKIKLVSLRSKKNIIKKISSTSELSFALMMNALRNVSKASQSIYNKKWEYLPYVGRQLDYMTVGVIGYGRLGKIFVNFLKPFKCKILIYEKNFKLRDKNKNYQSSLNKLLINSDIIALHIHADQENINFVDFKKLNKMKKNVIIVNTSRGEIVSETDLVKFLRKNKNSKYATDVVANEISNKWNSKIIKEYFKRKSNIIITPHIGGMTKEAKMLAFNAAADGLISLNKKLNYN